VSPNACDGTCALSLATLTHFITAGPESIRRASHCHSHTMSHSRAREHQRTIFIWKQRAVRNDSRAIAEASPRCSWSSCWPPKDVLVATLHKFYPSFLFSTTSSFVYPQVLSCSATSSIVYHMNGVMSFIPSISSPAAQEQHCSLKKRWYVLGSLGQHTAVPACWLPVLLLHCQLHFSCVPSVRRVVGVRYRSTCTQCQLLFALLLPKQMMQGC